MGTPGQGRIEGRIANILSIGMGRRELIAVICAGAIGWPSVVVAQQSDLLPKKPRVGFLVGVDPGGSALLDAFDRGLREHGYMEGQNLIIERRIWRDDREQLAKFAVELAAERVDVIVAVSTIDALAAKRATTTIPIVTITPGDPVGIGLAASLARPGGNVTGLSAQGLTTAKGLGLLAEAVPGASRFAALLDPGNPLHAQLLDVFEREAAQRHFSILRAVKRSADDIGPAFAAMVANGAQALYVFSDPITFENRRTIIELARKYQMPAAYFWRVEAVEGGLLAYGPDIDDLFRRSAGYVAKLLKGAKAAELPIEQAERFRLVINLKTAKALGLTISPSLLARADEVIE